jgi:predicted alpha/beta-hydrolase family hydrolase
MKTKKPFLSVTTSPSSVDRGCAVARFNFKEWAERRAREGRPITTSIKPKDKRLGWR